jgi:hypothetical protein
MAFGRVYLSWKSRIVQEEGPMPHVIFNFNTESVLKIRSAIFQDVVENLGMRLETGSKRK